MEGVAVGVQVHRVEVEDLAGCPRSETASGFEPGAEDDPVELLGMLVGELTEAPAMDFIHGRTEIRPSATSGKYCWLRVTPAANSDGSGVGAPYCSGLPAASSTACFSWRSTSSGGSISLAKVPYRV